MLRAAVLAALIAFPMDAVALPWGKAKPPKPSETSQTCTDGKIWDATRKTCVNAEESHLTDDDRYEAARELAHAGRYADALTVLAAADDPDDPRILTYRGFAHRKTGDLNRAIGLYRAALVHAPDSHLTRSYLGQGLAEAGDLAGATAQLREIRARGGRDTWAYQILKQSLAGKAAY
ncbi:MAG: hypothetical protein AAGE76_03880 [Pseudomonadota bacterium]